MGTKEGKHLKDNERGVDWRPSSFLDGFLEVMQSCLAKSICFGLLIVFLSSAFFSVLSINSFAETPTRLSNEDQKFLDSLSRGRVEHGNAHDSFNPNLLDRRANTIVLRFIRLRDGRQSRTGETIVDGGQWNRGEIEVDQTLEQQPEQSAENPSTSDGSMATENADIEVDPFFDPDFEEFWGEFEEEPKVIRYRHYLDEWQFNYLRTLNDRMIAEAEEKYGIRFQRPYSDEYKLDIENEANEVFLQLFLDEFIRKAEYKKGIEPRKLPPTVDFEIFEEEYNDQGELPSSIITAIPPNGRAPEAIHNDTYRVGHLSAGVDRFIAEYNRRFPEFDDPNRFDDEAAKFAAARILENLRDQHGITSIQNRKYSVNRDGRIAGLSDINSFHSREFLASLLKLRNAVAAEEFDPAPGEEIRITDGFPVSGSRTSFHFGSQDDLKNSGVADHLAQYTRRRHLLGASASLSENSRLGELSEEEIAKLYSESDTLIQKIIADHGVRFRYDLPEDVTAIEAESHATMLREFLRNVHAQLKAKKTFLHMAPHQSLTIVEQIDSNNLQFNLDRIAPRTNSEENDTQYVGHNSVSLLVNHLESNFPESKKFEDEGYKYAAMRILARIRDRYPEIEFQASDFSIHSDGRIENIDDIHSFKAREFLHGMIQIEDRIHDATNLQESVSLFESLGGHDETSVHNVYAPDASPEQIRRAIRLAQIFEDRRLFLAQNLNTNSIVNLSDEDRLGRLSNETVEFLYNESDQMIADLKEKHGVNFRYDRPSNVSSIEEEAHANSVFEFLRTMKRSLAESGKFYTAPNQSFTIVEQTDSDDFNLTLDRHAPRDDATQNDTQYVGHNIDLDLVAHLRRNFPENKKYEDQARKYAAMRILSQLRDQYPDMNFFASDFSVRRDGKIESVNDIQSFKAAEFLRGMLLLREKVHSNEDLQKTVLLFENWGDRDQSAPYILYTHNTTIQHSNEAMRLTELMVQRRKDLEAVLSNTARLGDLSDAEIILIDQAAEVLQKKLAEERGMPFRQELLQSSQVTEEEANSTHYFQFLNNFDRIAESSDFPTQVVPPTVHFEVSEDWEHSSQDSYWNTRSSPYQGNEENDYVRVPHNNVQEFLDFSKSSKFHFSQYAENPYIDESEKYAAARIIEELGNKYGLQIMGSTFSSRNDQLITSQHDINSFFTTQLLQGLLALKKGLEDGSLSFRNQFVTIVDSPNKVKEKSDFFYGSNENIQKEETIEHRQQYERRRKLLADSELIGANSRLGSLSAEEIASLYQASDELITEISSTHGLQLRYEKPENVSPNEAEAHATSTYEFLVNTKNRLEKEETSIVMGPLAEFIIEEQLDSDDLHIRNDLFPQRNEHDDNDVQYIGHNSIEDFVDRIESDYHEKKKYNDESRKYAALRILSQMRDQYPNFIFSAPEFTNTRDGSITEIDDINSVKAKELLMGLLHLREQLQNQIQEQVQEKMQQANQEKTKEQLRSEALLQIRLVALSYKETPDRDQHNLFYYGGSDKDRSHEAWRLMQLMANRRTALENVLKGIPVAEGDDRHRIGDLSENALAEIRRVNMNLENKILQDYGMRFRQEPRNSQQPSEIEAHTTAYYHFLSDYLKRAQNWNIDQRYMPESAAYEVVEDWEDRDLQRLPSVEINVPAYNDASKNDLERVPHLNAAEFIRHTGEFKYPYYLADSTFIYSNEAVKYSALEIIRELEGKGITINSPYYSIRPSENRNVGGENQSIHPIESVDDINSFRADYFLAYLLEIQEEVNRSEKKKKDLSELVGPVLTIGHNRRDNQWADGSRIHPYGLQEVDGIVTDWIARRAALGNTLDSADPTNNAYRLGAMTEKENALLKQKIAQLEALIGERLKVIPRLSQNLLDEISGTPQEEDILLRHYDFLTRFKNSRTWLWGRNRVFKHFLTKEIEVDGQTHTVYQHAPLSTVDTFVLEFDDTDHLHIPLRHSGTLADKFEEIMRRVVAAEELQKEQSETARNPADSDH